MICFAENRPLNLNLNINDLPAENNSEKTQKSGTSQESSLNGFKVPSLGLSLSSPNLHSVTMRSISSDSDNFLSDEHDTGACAQQTEETNLNDSDTTLTDSTESDMEEEAISGENDVEYAELSMSLPVPVRHNDIMQLNYNLSNNNDRDKIIPSTRLSSK